MREGFHAADLVAVATYSANRGTELVLGFTSDRAQAEAAIGSLGLPQLLDRAPDPLRLVVADYGAAASGICRPSGARAAARCARRAARPRGDRLADDRDPRGHAARQHEQQVRTAQNQVVALTRSFSDLAHMMASVDGRKHVVYLSEGFSPAPARPRLDRETGDAVAEGEGWKAEGETVYGSNRVQSDVERMLEAFRRADCVVQAVDIGGARAAGRRPRRSARATRKGATTAATPC